MYDNPEQQSAAELYTRMATDSIVKGPAFDAFTKGNYKPLEEMLQRALSVERMPSFELSDVANSLYYLGLRAMKRAGVEGSVEFSVGEARTNGSADAKGLYIYPQKVHDLLSTHQRYMKNGVDPAKALEFFVTSACEFINHEVEHISQQKAVKEAGTLDPHATLYVKESMLFDEQYKEFYKKNYYSTALEQGANIVSRQNTREDLRAFVSEQAAASYNDDGWWKKAEFGELHQSYGLSLGSLGTQEIDGPAHIAATKGADSLLMKNPELLEMYPALKIEYTADGRKKSYEELLQDKSKRLADLVRNGESNHSIVVLGKKVSKASALEQQYDNIVRSDPSLQRQQAQYMSKVADITHKKTSPEFSSLFEIVEQFKGIIEKAQPGSREAWQKTFTALDDQEVWNPESPLRFEGANGQSLRDVLKNPPTSREEAAEKLKQLQEILKNPIPPTKTDPIPVGDLEIFQDQTPIKVQNAVQKSVEDFSAHNNVSQALAGKAFTSFEAAVRNPLPEQWRGMSM